MCVSKLCVSKLCSKLCVDKLCVRKCGRRRAGGGRRERITKHKNLTQRCGRKICPDRNRF